MGGRGSKSGGGKSGGVKPQMTPTGAGPLMIVNKDLRQAIGEQGKPMSVKEAKEGANPNWADDVRFRPYRDNCQRCVVAYELRRRGYDVEALPSTTSVNTDADDLAKSAIWYDKNGSRAWQPKLGSAFKGGKWLKVPHTPYAYDADKQANSIESQLMKWGDGSRVIVVAALANGGGHAFNVEYSGGKFHWVDSQAHDNNGKTATSRQVRKWFTDKVGMSTIMRTDDLRISDRTKKFVTTVR